MWLLVRNDQLSRSVKNVFSSWLGKKGKKTAASENREEIWPLCNSRKDSVFRIHDVKSSSELMNHDLHLL